MVKPISTVSNHTFNHFVITLFNLKNFLDGTRIEEKWINWTIQRIQLFQNYCLPSIIQQTEKKFTWLLYFDSSTPEEILNNFKDSITFPNIEIILKNGFEDFASTYINDLKLRTPQNIEWIAQTRFDNDDILHKDAIKIIQSNFKAQNEFIISLASGYTYQEENKFLSHYFYPMSPFLTLIENNNVSMKGIYHCNHWQWPNLRLWMYKELLNLIGIRKEKVHFVLQQKLWIQLIHGSNMHNTSDRGFPVFKKIELDAFLNKLENIPSPIKRLYTHIHYVWWKRYFKSYTVMLLRRLFLKPD